MTAVPLHVAPHEDLAPVARSVRRWPPGLIIFGLALVLRLLWVFTLDNTLTWSDESEFSAVAHHLAQGDGYVSTSYRANPVLPFYLSVFFRLFGENYLGPRLGQSVIGAATCVLIYRIASGLISPSVGLISGLMLALYPPHIYLAGVFYVDCLTTFLLALSVYLASRTIQDSKGAWLAPMTGVSLGITALTRPTFLVYLPCVPIAWLFHHREDWRRRLRLCCILLSATAVTIVPWVVRNKVVYGRFVLSSGFYTKLWQGNNVLANGGPNDRELMWNTKDWQERLQRLDPQSQSSVEERYAAIDRTVAERAAEIGDAYLATDDVLKGIAIREILSDPIRTLSLMAKKTLTLFSAFSDTLTQNDHTTARVKLLAAMSFYPLLVLALMGAVVGLRTGAPLALLYLLIGSTTFVYALLTACTRFRLPLDPFLMIFAALAVDRMVSVVRNRKSPPGEACVGTREAPRALHMTGATAP